MYKDKMIILMFFLFILAFSQTLVFAGGPDVEGAYYTDDADQTREWSITITTLALVKDDGTEVPVISSGTNSVNIADPSVGGGNTAGYFTQNASIPVGTYTRIHLVQGVLQIFNGCVQIAGGTWRATGKGNTSYTTKAAALAAAVQETYSYGAVEDEYLPLSAPVTVSNEKQYELKILWKSRGTTPGIPAEGELDGPLGVGLLWDGSSFSGGALNETYTLVEV